MTSPVLPTLWLPWWQTRVPPATQSVITQEDNDKPLLTPSCFLLGCHQPSFPLTPFNTRTVTAESLVHPDPSGKVTQIVNFTWDYPAKMGPQHKSTNCGSYRAGICQLSCTSEAGKYSNRPVCWCWAESLSPIRLFATPWTVAHQAPLSTGILQARILEWVALPSSRRSSRPRNWTQVSHTAGRFCTSWATKEATSSEIRWRWAGQAPSLGVVSNAQVIPMWSQVCKPSKQGWPQGTSRQLFKYKLQAKAQHRPPDRRVI